MLLTLLPFTIKAQDTIYFFKSPPVVVKISSIEKSVVKYKRLSLPDGPDYVVSKRAIQSITFRDGTQANLQPLPKAPEDKLWPVNWMKGQTHVNLILTDLFLKFGGIEIEHNILKGKVGIKIPLSVGMVNITGIDSTAYSDWYGDNILFNGNCGYYNKNKTFSTGVELYVYPSGKDKVNYFFGPAFGYGEFKYINSMYPYYPNNSNRIKIGDAFYYSFFFKNGVRIQPLKQLNICVIVGTGTYKTTFKDLDYYGFSHEEQNLSMEGSISVGYTF